MNRTEAALARARAGEPVLPIWWTDEAGVCQCPKKANCPSPGKHPLTKNGLDDATCDEQTIQGWFTRWPNANLAVCTDLRPRFDVDLVEVAEALLEDVTLAYQAEVVRTPSGGLHVVLATEEPTPTKSLKLEDGRALGDLKAARAYVLVPPSKIGDREYKLLSPVEIGPLKVPDPCDWVRALLPAFGYHLASRGAGREHAYEGLAESIPEGSRHKTLTSYAGRIWVEGMSPEAFVASLEAVNGLQCEPPLPADEVDQIARWFTEGREQGVVGRTAQQRIEEAQRQLADKRPSTVWRPLPLGDDHFVRRYVRYAQSRTDAPPQYHEALALVQLSAVVGRSVHIPLAAKPDGMFCNLWLLMLGDSTLFRKTTSEDLAVDLLRAIDHEMFLANDQSPQGFLEEMAFRDGGPSVWHRDEFRSFLSQLKHASWMAGGKELLTKLYDGSPYYRRLRTKKHKGQEFPDEAKVETPYLVTIAAGVTSRIIDVLTIDDVIDGFLPRFIMAYPKERPPRRPAGTITEQIEAERRSLIDLLGAIRSGFAARGTCTVQFSPEVWRRWNEYAGEIEDEAATSPAPELFGPIAGRQADHALKVAALLQAAGGAPARGSNLLIEQSTLEASIELCERLRKDAEGLAMEVGSSTSERRLMRFVDMVKRSPGIQRTDVARALKVDKREMDSLEETALDRALISCGTKNTRGRSAKGYWCKGNGDEQP